MSKTLHKVGKYENIFNLFKIKSISEKPKTIIPPNDKKQNAFS